jgi:putative transposase
MVWQPKHLTTAQLEERRLAAAALLRAGKISQAEIARRMGVSRASVTRWKQHLEQEGKRGLRQRPRPGRPSRLTAAQWRQLLRRLKGGARAAGFATERWSLPRIGVVIERECGVHYHCRSLGAALRARGWSPQVPIPRARERDDALVAAWLKHDWPRLKKGLARAGAPLSSWMKRVTRFGPASAPPGRRSATRPS